MKILIGVLLLASLSWGRSEVNCVCYASGFAYDYGTKKFYYEDVHVSKRYKSDYGICHTQSYKFALNDWRRLFKSNVNDSHKYTLGVKDYCGYAKDSSKIRKRVHEDAQDWKGDFRSKKFSIRRIY